MKILISENEESDIKRMYGYLNLDKPKDRLEGIDYSEITNMKELIYYLSSRKFYDKLNELLGFEGQDKYGPKKGLYDIMEKFNIIMTRNEDGEIVLEKVPKYDE